MLTFQKLENMFGYTLVIVDCNMCMCMYILNMYIHCIIYMCIKRDTVVMTIQLNSGPSKKKK